MTRSSPLLLALALLAPSVATGQDGLEALGLGQEDNRLASVAVRNPEELRAFTEARERFTKRMTELEDDTRAFLDRREAEERAKLSEGYDTLIATLDELERNQRGLAMERFEAFLARYPDTTYAAHVRFRLADLYYEAASEQWLRDSRAYYARMEAAGDDPDLLEELGEEPQLDLGRPVELYERIIADNRDLPDGERYEYLDAAYYMLGYCYREPTAAQHDPDRAWAAFEELVLERPDSDLADAAHLFLGMHHFDEARWERAISEYRSVYEKGEKAKYYDGAMYQLAWSYYKLSEYAQGLALFTELLDYSDKQFYDTGRRSDYAPDAVKYMAHSFIDLGMEQDTDPSEVAVEFFARVGGKEWEREVFVALGEVLIEYARYEEAVVVYRKLQDDPRWATRAENPEYQMTIVRLLLSQTYADVAASAQARLELTERYNDRSEWWRANRNNPEALAVARKYIEASLADVAIEYYLKAEESGDPEQYKLAATKFREYLDKFPISDDYYMQQWYLGIALFKSGQLDLAEKEYVSLIKSRRYHDFGEGALFQLMQTRRKVVEDKFGSFDAVPEGTAVERTYTPESGKEIAVYQVTPEHKRFIEVADAVLGYEFKPPATPEDPDYAAAVDGARAALMYIPAQILYHHNRYEEARPRLMALLERMRQTDEASFACSLIVNSYLEEGDLGKVRQWTTECMRNPPGQDAALIAKGIEDFKDILEGAAFKQAFQPVEKAQDLESKGQRDEAYQLREQAATLMLQFIEDFPESEHVKLALYNAAGNYDKIGKAGKAIELYERYVREYPDDEQSRALFFRIASNYESTFELEKAIDYYEQLVKRFPDYVDAPVALFNSAFLRIGIGDHLGAARAFERYATQEPFNKQPDALDVHWRAGEQYAKVGDQQALKFYDDFLKRYGSAKPDYAVRAIYERAQIYDRQGNRRAYDKEMDRLLETFDKAAASGAELGWMSRHVAAESAFRAIQAEFDEFTKDELLPQTRRNEEKNMLLLLETKPPQLEKFQTAALEMINRYQDFEYSSAGLYLLGASYIYYADLGLSLRCPEGYSEEECMFYEELLYEQVYPKFENAQQKGMARLDALVKKSREDKKHSEWVSRAQVLLNEKNPFDYPAEKSEVQGVTDATILPDIRPKAPPADPKKETP